MRRYVGHLDRLADVIPDELQPLSHGLVLHPEDVGRAASGAFDFSLGFVLGLGAAGAAVAAALLIGIVGFAWQAKIARDQGDRAVYAEDQTKKRADELQKVADYQAKMLQQIDATEAGVKRMADLRTRHGAALDKSKVPEGEKLARTAAFERELLAVNATDTAVALPDRTVLG